MNFETYRTQFQQTREGIIYLLHAGVSPVSRRCADAMGEMVQWNVDIKSDYWPKVIQQMNTTRQSLATMLNVSTEEIALNRNTTEGINWVANGLDWKKGDEVISINGEYPANIYPWMALEKRGVSLKLIQPIDARITPEMIAREITPNTRLLTLSYVEFSTGFRFDLEAIGQLCKDRGILLLVDLIQGMGVFPLDLKRWNISFAAGGAQKWLLGPQGAGFFYCSRECSDQLSVTCSGAISVKNFLPFTNYDFTLCEDATRFEYGTPPTIPLIGLGAAVDLLLEVGMDTIRDRVRKLTDILIEGALKKKYRCISPRCNDEWSGIVILESPTETPEQIAERLGENKIIATEREGYLRLAPHFYQTEAEMNRVVEIL